MGYVFDMTKPGKKGDGPVTADDVRKQQEKNKKKEKSK